MKRLNYFYIFILVLSGFSCKSEEPETITGISASQSLFTEGNTNTTVDLTLTLQGNIRQPVTAEYTWMELTAVKGQDFEATDGSIEFTPEELSQTISFEIIGDTYLELEESLSLSLSVNGQQFGISIIIEDKDVIEEILTDAEGFYTPDTYPSMNLVWADEFDGNELNTEDWTYELGDGCDKGVCGWGNNELEIYTNEEKNIKLENGRITITARDEGNNVFTSARIITQDKVELTYGRIDIRAKLPKGQGIWPALWMLGANINDVSWPKCGEIDIMEVVGHEPATTHGTVHYDNNGYATTTGSRKISSGDLSDQFHVYTLIWEKDKIQWYLDNELFKNFAKQDNGYPFNAPFFFIMNVAVGGNWPGPPDGTTVFPQEMVVDYVRVFQ
ncbi:MAG: family 16 glycosylhydrolase [Bacteroidia bacterium]|nr:family 16 glycosylhydrolase [Bacteroidota bacterium]